MLPGAAPAAVDKDRQRFAHAPLVLAVDDCQARYTQWLAQGVEFTQEPIDRFGSVDAGFRDPAGNGWKMIQAPKSAT